VEMRGIPEPAQRLWTPRRNAHALLPAAPRTPPPPKQPLLPPPPHSEHLNRFFHNPRRFKCHTVPRTAAQLAPPKTSRRACAPTYLGSEDGHTQQLPSSCS
jgi:hypothetical protein